MKDKPVDQKTLNKQIRDRAWDLLGVVFCEQEGCACDELCPMCQAAFQLQLALQDWDKRSGEPDDRT